MVFFGNLSCSPSCSCRRMNAPPFFPSGGAGRGYYDTTYHKIWVYRWLFAFNCERPARPTCIEVRRYHLQGVLDVCGIREIPFNDTRQTASFFELQRLPRRLKVLYTYRVQRLSSHTSALHAKDFYVDEDDTPWLKQLWNFRKFLKDCKGQLFRTQSIPTQAQKSGG